MSARQEVAVADIIKELLSTNKQLITKVGAYQCVNQVFHQMDEADQKLHQGVKQAYDDISPSSRPSSPQRTTKRRRTDSKTTCEEQDLPTNEEPEEAIRCVCKSDLDTDASWISCEKCSVWQHMNCMQLSWTAEEAEQQRYLCEMCAPGEHQELLTMLKQGTWKALEFKSNEDEMEGLEETVEITMKNENEGAEAAPPKTDTESNLGIVAANNQTGSTEHDKHLHHVSRMSDTYPSFSALNKDIHNLEAAPPSEWIGGTPSQTQPTPNPQDPNNSEGTATAPKQKAPHQRRR